MDGKACIGFDLEDPSEAFYRHMDPETVVEYGDVYELKQLHVWHDGGRQLLRCRKCGGYILCQYSEYHGMEEGDDYSREFFPVSGPEEAREINEKLDGYEIISRFPRRWLSCDPGRTPYWSKPAEEK